VRVFLCSIFFCLSVNAALSPNTPQLSSEWIKDQIDNQGVKTIEALLAKFSPASLERHLLAYASRSDQFASWLSPRVVVYSYDADFILAFNGEPGSKGYFNLEMIRFDHKGKGFHPEIVRFDPAGIKKPEYDFKPTNCRGCHQQNFRPNWDPYFHWVGFYGSEDDNVNAGYEHKDGKLTTGKENEQYALFLEKKKDQIAKKIGRYRFLPAHPAERPNNDFNDRVTCLNMKRMVRAFEEQPLAARVWPHITYSRIKLSELPDDLLKMGRSFDTVKEETEKVLAAATEYRSKRHVEVVGELPSGRAKELLEKEIHRVNVIYDVDMISQWRFTFEEIFKQPFRHFSTTRTKDYHLNLGAATSLIQLWEDSYVDKTTGRVVFSEKPQFKDKSDYDYQCPRSKSERELLERPETPN